MQKRACLLLGILLTSNLALALREDEIIYENTLSPLADIQAEAAIDISEYIQRDCESSQKKYFPNQNQIVVCDKDFMFFSKLKTEKANYRGKIKIGSFNAFHLGDEQSFLKDLNFISKLISGWDLAAILEIMPPTSDQIKYNSSLDKYLDIKNIITPSGTTKDDIEYIIPAHLKILIDLQKINPHWSLVMGTKPVGEGSSGELAGFYFRSDKVEIMELSECGENSLACLVPFSDSIESLVSRPPFMAQFKIANKIVTALAVHARFRGLDLNNPEEFKKFEIQKNTLCKDNLEDACPKNQIELSRYYEIFATTNYLKKLKNNDPKRKLLFTGDFNLEWSLENQTKNASWKLALKNYEGLEVFQYGPSTISTKFDKLKSNYDHFIFNRSELSECSPESAKVIDLTNPKDSLPQSLVTHLNQWLTISGFTDYTQKLLLNEKTRLLISSKRETEAIFDFAQNIPSQNDNLKKYEERISTRYNKVITKNSPKTIDKVNAIVELVSDHVPIEMNCEF